MDRDVWIIIGILAFCAVSAYFWIEGSKRQRKRNKEHAERLREADTEGKKRRAEKAALEEQIAESEASFLAKYDDFDEDDSKESKKALSKEGVELSELYVKLAGFHTAKPRVYYVHVESSYQTLLKALSVLPTRAKVRVLALERGRELAEIGRTLQGTGTITIYDETAIQNDLAAYGGSSQPT